MGPQIKKEAQLMTAVTSPPTCEATDPCTKSAAACWQMWQNGGGAYWIASGSFETTTRTRRC